MQCGTESGNDGLPLATCPDNRAKVEVVVCLYPYQRIYSPYYSGTDIMHPLFVGMLTGRQKCFAVSNHIMPSSYKHGAMTYGQSVNVVRKTSAIWLLVREIFHQINKIENVLTC